MTLKGTKYICQWETVTKKYAATEFVQQDPVASLNEIHPS